MNEPMRSKFTCVCLYFAQLLEAGRCILELYNAIDFEYNRVVLFAGVMYIALV